MHELVGVILPLEEAGGLRQIIQVKVEMGKVKRHYLFWIMPFNSIPGKYTIQGNSFSFRE
jgi:hypothetical protein